MRNSPYGIDASVIVSRRGQVWHHSPTELQTEGGGTRLQRRGLVAVVPGLALLGHVREWDVCGGQGLSGTERVGPPVRGGRLQD